MKFETKFIWVLVFGFSLMWSCKKDPFILPDTVDISTLEDWELYAPHLRGVEQIERSLVIGLDSIPDPTVFCELKKVGLNLVLGGECSFDESIEMFKNLEEIGNDLGLFFDSVDSISFPNLRHVGNSLTISTRGSLRSISFPLLDSVPAISILDNPLLEFFSGADSLQTMSEFKIQRNPNFRLIDGFRSLEYIQVTLGFDLTMNMAPGSFENLTTVGLTGIGLFVDDENDYDYSWLSNVQETPAINVTKFVRVSELCPLKAFAEKYPERIGGLSWYDGEYSGIDILDACE